MHPLLPRAPRPKKSKLKIVIIIVMLAAVIGIIIYLVDTQRTHNSYTKGSLFKSNMQLATLLIINSIYASTHDYNSTTFNCLNYTMDMFDIANKLGYDVMYVVGYPENVSENNTPHAWLRFYVDIEPQSAQIINYDNKYPTQEIKKVSNQIQQ